MPTIPYIRAEITAIAPDGVSFRLFSSRGGRARWGISLTPEIPSESELLSLRGLEDGGELDLTAMQASEETAAIGLPPTKPWTLWAFLGGVLPPCKVYEVK